MAEQRPSHLWFMRLSYAGLGLLIIFFQLLPLETTPRRWAPPDLLLGMTLAWALRRPDYTPAALVALVMFLADLLFQRPPGLWAALVVIACEWLRGRSRGLRDQTFVAEWFTIAIALFGLTVAYRVILALTMIPAAPLGLTVMQMLLTLAIYPAIALVSHFVFGVRLTARGEVDTLGHRL